MRDSPRLHSSGEPGRHAGDVSVLQRHAFSEPGLEHYRHRLSRRQRLQGCHWHREWRQRRQFRRRRLCLHPDHENLHERERGGLEWPICAIFDHAAHGQWHVYDENPGRGRPRGQSTPRGLVLRWSFDNYGSNLGVATVSQNWPNTGTYTFNLNAFAGGTVSFRLYAYADPSDSVEPSVRMKSLSVLATSSITRPGSRPRARSSPRATKATTSAAPPAAPWVSAP